MTPSVDSVRPLDSSPREITVQFRATRSMPRRLDVMLREGDSVRCAMYAPGKCGRRIAFACGKLAGLRLCYRYGIDVWLDGACFELLPEEAEQLEKAFGPLGLLIEREKQK